MSKLHKLLQRQLKKHLGMVEVPQELEKFVFAVNDAYVQQDSDRLLIERAMELSSNELSEAIEQLKDTQTQLVHREKMASIGQLAAGVAHEINNPLGFVMSNMDTLNKNMSAFLGFAELCESALAQVQDNQSEALRRILKEIAEYKKSKHIDFIMEDTKDLIEESIEGLERISRIVKGLKDFSRVDCQKEYGDYDLNNGVKSTLVIANNEIKYVAAVKLELGEIPVIQALGSEINQVILNIIINAAHAIKETEHLGTINIRTFTQQDEVLLEIEDNGTGIAPENLESVFNPFYTTKPVGQGTGLGLSIAYDIITNKHKGKISVRSTLGVRTTFTVALPIHANE